MMYSIKYKFNCTSFAIRLTSASPGFMGKSQMIEFVKEIQQGFEPEEFYPSHDEPVRVPPVVDFDYRRMISFEIFHRVATRVGLSIGLQHSRIIWVLMNNENSVSTSSRQFVVAGDAFEHLIRFYLQPLNASGKRIYSLSMQLKNFFFFFKVNGLNVARPLLTYTNIEVV